MPTGTLTKNISRHDSQCTMSPPTVGPRRGPISAGMMTKFIAAEQANLAWLLVQAATLCVEVGADWSADRAADFRAEARALLDEALRAARVGGSLYRNLMVTLAEWTVTDPRMQDELAAMDEGIGLLERALEPAPLMAAKAVAAAPVTAPAARARQPLTAAALARAEARWSRGPAPRSAAAPHFPATTPGIET